MRFSARFGPRFYAFGESPQFNHIVFASNPLISHIQPGKIAVLAHYPGGKRCDDIAGHTCKWQDINNSRTSLTHHFQCLAESGHGLAADADRQIRFDKIQCFSNGAFALPIEPF